MEALERATHLEDMKLWVSAVTDYLPSKRAVGRVYVLEHILRHLPPNLRRLSIKIVVNGSFWEQAELGRIDWSDIRRSIDRAGALEVVTLRLLRGGRSRGPPTWKISNLPLIIGAFQDFSLVFRTYLIEMALRELTSSQRMTGLQIRSGLSA